MYISPACGSVCLSADTPTYARVSHTVTHRHTCPCVGDFCSVLAPRMIRPEGGSPESRWGCVWLPCSPHVRGFCLFTRYPWPSPWVGQHRAQGPEGQPPNGAEEAHPPYGLAQMDSGALGGRRQVLGCCFPCPSCSRHCFVVSSLHPSPAQPPGPAGHAAHHVLLCGHTGLSLGSGLWLVLPCPVWLILGLGLLGKFHGSTKSWP